MDNNTKIAKAKTRLVFKYPFFGSCALGLNFIETDKVSTMATDGRSIRWNPEFVEKLSDEEVAGVVAHEVLHVVFKHCLRQKSNAEKWNVATDMVINDILINERIALPGGAILCKDEYKKWNAERIYKNLPNEINMPSWGIVTLTKASNGEDLSETERLQIEVELNSKILMAYDLAKAVGKEPGNAIGELINELRNPQVDWKDVFNRKIGGEQPDDYTWKRPNKKIYYTQNIYMPSVEKYGAGDIIIAIDTSGSISNKEAEYFLTELNTISEIHKPNSITIIQCDSDIQDVKEYGQGEFIDNIRMKGRGGTDCLPVFEYIENNNLPCDNFVYLTDLEMYRFPHETPHYPVLWITTNYVKAPFGEITKLKME